MGAGSYRYEDVDFHAGAPDGYRRVAHAKGRKRAAGKISGC